MSTSAADRARLRMFVAELLLDRGDRAAFSDSSSLLGSGRLDSLSAIELITFLEQEFAVDFDAVDFDFSCVDSVDAMAALLEGPR